MLPFRKISNVTTTGLRTDASEILRSPVACDLIANQLLVIPEAIPERTGAPRSDATSARRLTKHRRCRSLPGAAIDLIGSRLRDWAVLLRRLGSGFFCAFRLFRAMASGSG